MNLTRTTVKVLFVALAAVNIAPASAATFSFSGDLTALGTTRAVEGSYTVDDSIIASLLQQPLSPSAPSSFDPNTRLVDNAVSSFSLSFVNGESLVNPLTPPSSSLTTYLSSSGEDEQFTFGTPVLAVSVGQPVFGPDTFGFSMQVTGGPNLEQCLVGDCTGFAFYSRPMLAAEGTVSQQPATSVPEPDAALGLFVVGALMAIYKCRKLNARRT